MSALEARGGAIAEAAQARLAGRVQNALTAVPGIEASVDGDRVVLTGRGLARRMLSDPALRWVAGLLK